jgi:hypothetical protein
MVKTMFGYSAKKLQEKADKRGLSLESYVNYLKYRQNFRGSRKKGTDV